MAEDDIMNNISNVNAIGDLLLNKNKKTYNIFITTYAIHSIYAAK